MKTSNIKTREIKSGRTITRSGYLRRVIVFSLSGALFMGLSACNEEAETEVADALAENAEALTISHPVNLAQHQTTDKHHGPFGFRQPGYVNQDAYITENIFGVKNMAYYGDWDSNRVYIIDVDNMALLTSVEGTGDGPYGIDQQGANKAYALTRRTESLTVVDNYTLEKDRKSVV